MRSRMVGEKRKKKSAKFTKQTPVVSKKKRRDKLK